MADVRNIGEVVYEIDSSKNVRDIGEIVYEVDSKKSKTVVPWGLHPLPKWVYKEMQRRGNEYGQNVLESQGSYSGPRTAWVRFFSNGKSKMPGAENMDGFVLGGVYDFDETFGLTNDGYVTIGVDSRGNPHRIPHDTAVSISNDEKTVFSSDFPHRPPPSLESITCEMAGATTGFPNACRKITVNFKCHSLAQLNYLTPYFFTPRITCLVEWGWNNYDTISLVDLTDLDWINNMFVDPSYTLQYLKDSNGNYDAGLGFVVDYGYKMNDAGGYDCFTTLINANRLIEGELLHNQSATIQKNDSKIAIKKFTEFVDRDLKNIDSKKYASLRQQYRIGIPTVDGGIDDNIEDRVFRIDQKESSENKPGLWLRMDVIQDIINGFFQITMNNPKEAIIRRLTFEDVKVSANPFLKAVGTNILVPNQYAPRFIFQDKAKASATVEDGKYTNLFKQKASLITEEYKLDPTKFDDLREAINPNGESFPVYRDLDIKDVDDNPSDQVEADTAQRLKSGYWGYLTDLYVHADHFADLVKKNDSLLKLLEQLLQDINESLCQICQLRLIPAEYGNAVYSVFDENLTSVSTAKDAARLPKISLGSINNNSITSIRFDVKISQEMMNQLVHQSANPPKDGSIEKTETKSKPIISRYSDGDRLYEKGTIETVSSSDSSPEADNKTAEEIKAETEAVQAEKEAADKLKKEEAEALKKKQLERSEANFKKEKCIFYKKNAQNELIKYYICEPEKDFMNYVLSLPDTNASYLNNAIMPGTNLQLELLGISGVDYLSQFTIDHAPEPYCYRNAVWQISDIKQTVSEKVWKTNITAQVRPLTILK